MGSVIYFDHNATTPVHPAVKEAMNEAMDEFWANPSSTHSMGRHAFARLEKAREKLAELIDSSPKEIFFTSGGTESDNLAILGTMDRSTKNGQLLVSSIEHPAVLEPAKMIAKNGGKVNFIPVSSDGIIKLDCLEQIISQNTVLVSVMYANNEIGTIQPIEEVASILKQKKILFHTDAVQAFGKIPIDVKEHNIHLMSVSSHKIYGPKGCGALYIRQGTKLNPRTFGGSQERHMRTGTENLPAIIGFAKAAEIACSSIENTSKYLFDLTEFMYWEIKKNIENVIRNGHPEKRIPGTLSMCFPGAETEILLASLDQEGICASGGSACSSGSIGASHTLEAIGRRKTEAVSVIRFSLGSSNTKDEVMRVVQVIKKAVDRIRTVNS
jgi:cysteine desulfurase